MAKTSITRRELDAWLDPAADSPERFDALVAEKIAAADDLGLALEIRDPSSWRKPAGSPRAERPTTFLNQFRFDVDSILIMDRQAEAQLARAVEFARAL